MKLNSSKNITKDTENTYSYPIFNYEIDSDLNYERPEKYISHKQNDSKVNKTYKPNKPRYRFKNNSKLVSTSSFLKAMKNFENLNFTSFVNLEIDSNDTRNYNNNKLVYENITETIEMRQSNFENNSLNASHFQRANESSEGQKLLKYSDPQNTSEKFCVTSIDCDIKLNERCIDRHKYSICGCKEPFFRENVSKKCQIKKLIRLLFKVSSNHSNQLNSNSLELIQMKYSIERNIWSFILNSSHLLTIVDNIKVIELIDSKIVVDFYVKIANPSNNFHHKYIEYHFWYRLMSIIRGIHFDSNDNNLNSFDLRAIEIVDDIDYCSVKELNYCSESAICLDNNKSVTKFQCRCKSGLTDLSPNIDFKGEICALKCNSDICGVGGVCQIRNDTEIHCICTDWKFGDRCQYSFYTFVCVASLFVIISIFFSVCLASLYCGYKIHEEFGKLRKLLIQVSILCFTFSIK